MKPNDKAYQAARAALLKAMAERNCIIAGVPFNENNYDEFDAGEAVEHAKVALDAAYAAQFPPNEDYAGFVDGLREWAGQYEGITLAGEEIIGQAADAIEAVLAERDALKAELDAANGRVHAAELHAAGMMTQRDIAIRERDAALTEIDVISSAIKSQRYMDPPDGGSVTIVEQVARLWEDNETLRTERDALKAELIDYKDAAASEADIVNELDEKIRELNVEIDKWESAYKEITDTRVKIEETTVDKLKKVESERDALLARLAPEAMLEGARAAIEAMRPIIEAADKEDSFTLESNARLAPAPTAQTPIANQFGAVNSNYSIKNAVFDKNGQMLSGEICPYPAPVEAIESDKDDPTREYIPLPGGWEIQTKGKGSSYRLLDKKTGERHMILAGEAPFVQEFVTRMAKEINAIAQVGVSDETER